MTIGIGGPENCAGNYCVLLLPSLNSKFEALSMLNFDGVLRLGFLLEVASAQYLLSFPARRMMNKRRSDSCSKAPKKLLLPLLVTWDG